MGFYEDLGGFGVFGFWGLGFRVWVHGVGIT